jgi:hypothetical protein
MGTGLLPLCDAAAATWQRAENRGTEPSPLAVKSIRTLVSTMAAVIQSRSGAKRWCETAFAAHEAAETFLLIFPEATIVCLHRSLQGVLAEGLAAYPWGLGRSPFWPYSGGHPGNNVATIATYWAACTEPLLDFEANHQDSCLRVRYEDLCTDPDRQMDEIFMHLGLDSHERITPGPLPDLWSLAGQEDISPEPPVPTAHMPPQLLAKLRELHKRLNYAL